MCHLDEPLTTFFSPLLPCLYPSYWSQSWIIPDICLFGSFTPKLVLKMRENYLWPQWSPVTLSEIPTPDLSYCLQLENLECPHLDFSSDFSSCWDNRAFSASSELTPAFLSTSSFVIYSRKPILHDFICCAYLEALCSLTSFFVNVVLLATASN